MEKNENAVVDGLLRFLRKNAKGVAFSHDENYGGSGFSFKTDEKFAKGGFIAMYNGKKAEIEADTLLEAKKKAIEKLNVPKSKQGLLSVVPNSFMENEDFIYMAKGGYVVVGDKDGFWSVVSTPVSKAKAKELLKDTTFPKGEKGKIVSVAEAMSHKKVIGKEYLESGGTIVAADPSAAIEDLNQTYGYESVFEKGGRLGFDGLAKKVAKRYEGQKVPSKFRKEYGKTYSKEEAMEVGRKVAAKVYGQQQAKMEMGGEITQPYSLINSGSADYVAGSNTMSNMFAKGGYLVRFEDEGKYETQKFATLDKAKDFYNFISEQKMNYGPQKTQLISNEDGKVLMGANELPQLAKGGSLESHGLKDGDVIMTTSEEFIKVLDKDGVPYFVNLANG
jgi:hypothetical protein